MNLNKIKLYVNGRHKEKIQINFKNIYLQTSRLTLKLLGFYTTPFCLKTRLNLVYANYSSTLFPRLIKRLTANSLNYPSLLPIKTLAIFYQSNVYFTVKLWHVHNCTQSKSFEIIYRINIETESYMRRANKLYVFQWEPKQRFCRKTAVLSYQFFSLSSRVKWQMVRRKPFLALYAYSPVFQYNLFFEFLSNSDVEYHIGNVTIVV